MPDYVHFTQPLWFAALLPLAGLLWLLARRRHASSPWRRLVDPQLQPLLLDDGEGRRPRLPLWILSIGWLLAVLSLADPAWEQQPQPLRQTTASRVIVLDLSRSMLVADLKPSRLVRARFKVEDILAQDAEGQTGLVVFAGDAFIVSPLTRDADTIRAQLKALDPSIMPAQGSRADLGLLRAHDLLQQANADNGLVILIADGAEGTGTEAAAARLYESGHRVAVLGVGTAAGAPLPDGRGGTLRDVDGKPLVPGLDEQLLAGIADAGGGRYSRIQGGPADLDHLLRPLSPGVGESMEVDEMQAQKWQGQGPLLAVLLLPLAALAFRRGWLLGIFLCAGTLVSPQPAMALDWERLWQRKDQLADRALRVGEYEQAAQLAEDPARRASALYRQGDYDGALQGFAATPGADGAYNRGNALASLGRYPEAISAYDQALELQPDMEDALVNRAAVQALLERQREQQESSSTQNDQERSSQAQDDSGGPADQQESANDQQSSSEQGEAGDASSSAQNQAAPGTDGSEQQHQGEQQAAAGEQESTTGSSGESEADAQQAESNPAQETQNGRPDAGGSGPDGAENQFAEANRQLDRLEGEPGEGREADPPAEVQEDATAGAGRMAQQAHPDDPFGHRPETEPSTVAEALNEEEQMAAQQWLRRIPDDPGGLLRRKFLYQYRQRGGQSGGQGW